MNVILPAGTIWPWNALVTPPDGWRFMPTHVKYMTWAPLPIVATRDHHEYPQVPAAELGRVLRSQDRQGQVVGGDRQVKP